MTDDPFVPDPFSGTALAVYRLLRDRGKLEHYRALTYRCPHGCVLAHVLRTPHGAIVYQPSYRRSPTANTGTLDAKSRNTLDGDRRWRERAFVLRDWLTTELNCDHLMRVPLTPSQVRADLADGADSVTVVESELQARWRREVADTPVVRWVRETGNSMP